MLFITPVLNRELISFLRRRRAFWLLFSYLCFFGFLAASAWASGSLGGMMGDRSAFSRALFQRYSYVQLVVFGLGAVVMCARQIGTERRQGTFDALITTALSAREIMIGKALAAVGYLLLLVVASLPFYALCFLLGGVGWTEVVAALYLTCLAGLTYAMVGVASSAPPARKRTQVTQGGLGVVLLLNGGLALGLSLLLLFVFSVPQHLIDDIALITFIVLSPLGSFYGLTGPFPLGARPLGAAFAPLLIVAHTVVQVGVFLLFLYLGCRALHKESLVAVPRAAQQPRRRGEIAQPRSRLDFLRLFPIPDWLNPVAAKDFLLALPRSRLGRMGLVMLWVVIFCLAAWAIVESRLMLRAATAETMFGILSIAAAGTVCLLVYLRASGVVAAEKESGTLAPLTITPLRPSAVMAGKLQSVVATVAGAVSLFYVSLTIVACLCFPRMIPHAVVRLPLVLLAMAASSAFYGAIAIRISAGARTVRGAGNSAVILGFLCFFLLSPVLAVIDMLRGAPGLYDYMDDILAFFVALLFPVAMVFLPADDPFHSDLLGWAFYAIGIGASFGMAWLFVRWAGAVYAVSAIKDQEGRGAKP